VAVNTSSFFIILLQSNQKVVTFAEDRGASQLTIVLPKIAFR